MIQGVLYTACICKIIRAANNMMLLYPLTVCLFSIFSFTFVSSSCKFLTPFTKNYNDRSKSVDFVSSFSSLSAYTKIPDPLLGFLDILHVHAMCQSSNFKKFLTDRACDCSTCFSTILMLKALFDDNDINDQSSITLLSIVVNNNEKFLLGKAFKNLGLRAWPLRTRLFEYRNEKRKKVTISMPIDQGYFLGYLQSNTPRSFILVFLDSTKSNTGLLSCSSSLLMKERMEYILGISPSRLDFLQNLALIRMFKSSTSEFSCYHHFINPADGPQTIQSRHAIFSYAQTIQLLLKHLFTTMAQLITVDDSTKSHPPGCKNFFDLLDMFSEIPDVADVVNDCKLCLYTRQEKLGKRPCLIKHILIKPFSFHLYNEAKFLTGPSGHLHRLRFLEKLDERKRLLGWTSHSRIFYIEHDCFTLWAEKGSKLESVGLVSPVLLYVSFPLSCSSSTTRFVYQNKMLVGVSKLCELMDNLLKKRLDACGDSVRIKKQATLQVYKAIAETCSKHETAHKRDQLCCRWD